MWQDTHLVNSKTNKAPLCAPPSNRWLTYRITRSRTCLHSQTRLLHSQASSPTIILWKRWEQAFSTAQHIPSNQTQRVTKFLFQIALCARATSIYACLVPKPSISWQCPDMSGCPRIKVLSLARCTLKSVCPSFGSLNFLETLKVWTRPRSCLCQPPCVQNQPFAWAGLRCAMVAGKKSNSVDR